MAIVKEDGSFSQYYHGKDWHLSEELAKCQAEIMRVKKIKSLERQIEKLKNMQF